MPTFAVICTVCKSGKWPTLPYRPAGYVCVLCTSVEPGKRAARVAAGKRGRSRVQHGSGDATEAP